MLSAALGLAGCASEPNDRVLDCGYLAQDNCWAEAVAAAAQCAAPAGQVGTFGDDDALTCRFGTSPVTAFFEQPPPIDLPPPIDRTYVVDLLNAGQPCARLEDLDGGGVAITTAAGTTSFAFSGDGAVLSCPGVADRTAASRTELAACAGVNYPARSVSFVRRTLSYALLGAASGPTALFACDLR